MQPSDRHRQPSLHSDHISQDPATPRAWSMGPFAPVLAGRGASGPGLLQGGVAADGGPAPPCPLMGSDTLLEKGLALGGGGPSALLGAIASSGSPSVSLKVWRGATSGTRSMPCST